MAMSTYSRFDDWFEICNQSMKQDIRQFDEMLADRKINKAQHESLKKQAAEAWGGAAKRGPDTLRVEPITYEVGDLRIRTRAQLLMSPGLNFSRANPYGLDDIRHYPPPPSGLGSAVKPKDSETTSPKRRRDLLLLTMKGQ